MITQMCQFLDTIYVSGWQSSSTASSTDEPSPDLADYPMVSVHPCKGVDSGMEFGVDSQKTLIGHCTSQGQPVVHGTALP